MNRDFFLLIIIIFSFFSCKTNPTDNTSNESDSTFDPVGLYFYIDFYTDVNGTKLPPYFYNEEKLSLKTGADNICCTQTIDFTSDGKSPPAFMSVYDSSATFFYSIPTNNGPYSLDTLSFKIGDIQKEYENEERIYLGDYELSFDGIYLEGSILDPYHNFEYEIELRIDGVIFPVDKDGTFIAPVPKKDTYSLSIYSEAHNSLVKSFSLDSIPNIDSKWSLPNIELTNALYKVNGKVNFINPDGSIGNPKKVDVSIFNRVFETDLNGEYLYEGLFINSNQNYSTQLIANAGNDYSITIDSATIDSLNYEISFETNVYKYSTDSILFFPEPMEGLKWDYEFIYYDDGLTSKGTLSWEITEVSDSIFQLLQTVNLQQDIIQDIFEVNYSDSANLVFRSSTTPNIDLFESLDNRLQILNGRTFIDTITKTKKGRLKTSDKFHESIIILKENYGITYLNSSLTISMLIDNDPVFGPFYGETYTSFQLRRITE